MKSNLELLNKKVWDKCFTIQTMHRLLKEGRNENVEKSFLIDVEDHVNENFEFADDKIDEANSVLSLFDVECVANGAYSNGGDAYVNGIEVIFTDKSTDEIYINQLVDDSYSEGYVFNSKFIKVKPVEKIITDYVPV